MTYRYKSLEIQQVGIIGSGQIGPDIALHFTKVLSPHGVPVVVVDVAPEALEAGRAKLHKKIDRGVKSRAFRPEQAEAMKGNVSFTTDYERLRGSSLIVEAATEDAGLKGRIFGQVSEMCPDAVLASNSSHLEPGEIFAGLQERSRTLVVHYFFPAERNPALEIIPGPDTDPALVALLLGFYEQIGKVPVQVGSRYGYAVDPIFEGIFQAAAACVEQGMGTTKEVDAAAARALGLTVGPFTAMNLTGGNPITNHGLDMSHDRIHPWYRSPQLMKDQVAKGEPWDVPGRGETVTLPEAQETRIRDAMQGAYLGLAGDVLDSGIITPADLEMIVEIALDLTPPLRLMNELGVARSLDLVKAYAEANPPFGVSRRIAAQAESGQPWPIELVTRRDVDGVAVVTIRRPRVLNALNEQVFAQIDAHFATIAEDDTIRAAVLTGFGTKAFVSGADVAFIQRMDSPEAGERSSLESQAVGRRIESLGKPVIAAYNGLAFGGGNETGMCCTARIIRSGLKVAVGQPEVNLGILPGAGGTQRLPRLVGMETAARMIRTGRPLSSTEAVETGLCLEEVPPERLLDRAVELARDAADGKIDLPRLDPAPMDVPDSLPELELGHLSRAVDAIVTRALLEGCAKPLQEGLRHEAAMFAEICRTEDMAIGLKNFFENGPRAKAPFVHR